MPEFDYSTDAKNVLNRFFQVDRVVYVEGEDDIPFWEIVFDKLTNIQVKIEAVGGKPELLKHAEAIYENEAEYFLAMDSDFDRVFDVEKHPAIIRTCGYSIENTLICKESICRIIRNLARIPKRNVPYEACEEWLTDLNEKIKDIVLSDVVNTKEELGLSVVPDSSERFMKSANSPYISNEKISDFVERLGIYKVEKFTPEIENLDIKRIVYLDAIRGHFLFSAVMKFVKIKTRSLGKNVSVSKDMLYSNLVSVFESVFNRDHPHYDFYKNELAPLPRDA